MTIDFDKEHLCPDCRVPMQVLIPLWVTPGAEEIHFADIDYESSNPDWADNWFCPECEGHHFPLQGD